MTVGRVWRYQTVIRIRQSKNDRQHNGQKKKYKRKNNDLQNITRKIKDRVTRTSLKTEDKLRWSGRVSSSFSTKFVIIFSSFQTIFDLYVHAICSHAQNIFVFFNLVLVYILYFDSYWQQFQNQSFKTYENILINLSWQLFYLFCSCI
jgi:hypothetical protein